MSARRRGRDEQVRGAERTTDSQEGGKGGGCTGDGAPERSPERTVCIVLHDAAPSTRPACLRTLAAVREVAGDAPVTILAVPRYHDEAPTPAFEAWLGERSRAATSSRCTAAPIATTARRRAGSTACAAAATPAAKASSGRSRAPRRWRASMSASTGSRRTAGRSPASSRRRGCSGRGRARRWSSGRSTTPRRCASSSTCRRTSR